MEKDNVPESQEPVTSHSVTPIQPHKVASAARSWSVKEDEVLITCYMEHCTDAIIGSHQKASMLWRKVAQSWGDAQVNRPHELPPRGPKMLENRWRRMASDINLWTGCYEEAKKATGIVYNEDNIVQTAHTLYRASAIPTRNFSCEHGWRMLRQYPKWRLKMRWATSKKERNSANVEDDEESSSGKRNKIDKDDDIGMGSGSRISGGIPRHDGDNNEKPKGKDNEVSRDVASTSDTILDHNELYSRSVNFHMRKIELEEKKFVTKQKQYDLDTMKAEYDMLQVLIAKASPTTREEMLKEKLLLKVYSQLD